MKEIPLTQGQVALVDDWWFDWLNQWSWYTWRSRGALYARRGDWDPITKKDTKLAMHHAVMGKPKKGWDVDHWDHNGCNNQEANLRIVPHGENLWNEGKYKNNTSGYKGVTWHALRKKWMAQISVNRTRLYLGIFDNILDAHLAYSEAQMKYHGKVFAPDPCQALEKSNTPLN